MVSGNTPLRRLIKVAAPGLLDSLRNNRMEEYLGLPMRRAPLPQPQKTQAPTATLSVPSLPEGGLGPASGRFVVGTSIKAPTFATPRNKAQPSVEALAYPDRRVEPTMSIPVAPRARPPVESSPSGPDPRAIANAARQIARSVGFPRVGRGVFSDTSKAQNFIDLNPRFSALARKRLGL